MNSRGLVARLARDRGRDHVPLAWQELADPLPVLCPRDPGRARTRGRCGRSPASRTSTPARPGRSRTAATRPSSRSSPGVRSIPARCPPSAVGTPTMTTGRLMPGMVRHHARDAHRRLRARAFLRPLGVRGRSTFSARRTSRATRWPRSSPSPTTRCATPGRASRSATRSRPATRCSAARSPRLYETIEPDEVLTFAGAEEAIFCLMNVLTGPGDHVIVTWPGYQSLYEVARAAGADVTLHELHETAGWALDLDLLRRQITPATRLIVVNAPHNPTGMLPDRATFDGLVALAAEAGAHLLMDEVYRGLEFDEARPTACRRRRAAERRLPRRHVEVVRDGRSPDRLAGDPRSRPSRSSGEVQGLHDDLFLGAIRDPRDHRAASARPGPGAVARDRRREPRAARRLLRGLGGPVHMGPSASRFDRLPAVDRPRHHHR